LFELRPSHQLNNIMPKYNDQVQHLTYTNSDHEQNNYSKPSIKFLVHFLSQKNKCWLAKWNLIHQTRCGLFVLWLLILPRHCPTNSLSNTNTQFVLCVKCQPMYVSVLPRKTSDSTRFQIVIVQSSVPVFLMLCYVVLGNDIIILF
jgi:hypothetical protein